MTIMNSHDQACFDQWIEDFATDAELALPYAQQVEAHILWLNAGGDHIELENIAREEFDNEH